MNNAFLLLKKSFRLLAMDQLEWDILWDFFLIELRTFLFRFLSNSFVLELQLFRFRGFLKSLLDSLVISERFNR